MKYFLSKTVHNQGALRLSKKKRRHFVIKYNDLPVQRPAMDKVCLMTGHKEVTLPANVNFCFNTFVNFYDKQHVGAYSKLILILFLVYKYKIPVFSG
jgi:hypothetical protein